MSMTRRSEPPAPPTTARGSGGKPPKVRGQVGFDHADPWRHQSLSDMARASALTCSALPGCLLLVVGMTLVVLLVAFAR